MHLLEQAVLKPDEVAKVLRISRSTVYEMIRDGEIPVTEVRGAYRIPTKKLIEKFGLGA